MYDVIWNTFELSIFTIYPSSDSGIEIDVTFAECYADIFILSWKDVVKVLGHHFSLYYSDSFLNPSIFCAY